MIDGKRIIAFTPAGRRRYMEILLRYVKRDHDAGVVDEWWLFENAFDRNDRAYLEELERTYPWVRLVHEPDGYRDGYRIHAFYKHFDDPNAIYVRLDDDIVYVSPTAIERVARAAADPMMAPFLCYPTILGNTRMEYWLQQAGKIPEDWGVLSDDILTPIAYTDPEFIALIHRAAIASIEDGTLAEDFYMPSRVLPNQPEEGQSSPSGHISINCFALNGLDMIDLKDKIGSDEERFLSQYRPSELDRRNIIVGEDAIVIHFAYHTQREELEKTDLLERYKNLAPSL